MAVDVDIELQVKIDNLRKELEKIPGISAKESKKMAAAWSREYKAMERSSERARKSIVSDAKKVRDEFDGKLKGTFDSSRKALAAWGGSAGTAAQLGGDLIEAAVGMGNALGPAGLAAAAATLSVTGLVAASVAFNKAAVDMARRATEAQERLQGLGLATEDLTELNSAVEAMDIAFDQLTVGIASATPELTQFLDRIIGLTLKGNEFVTFLSDSSKAVNDLADNMLGWAHSDSAVGQLRDAVFSYGETFEEAGRQQREAIKEALELQKMEKEALEDIEKGKRAQAAADKQRTKQWIALENERWKEAGRIAAARVRSEQAVGEALATREAEAEAAWMKQREELNRAAQNWQQVEASANAAGQAMLDSVGEEQLAALEQLGEMTWDIVNGAMAARMDAIVEQEQVARRQFRKEQDRLKAEKERIEAQIESGRIAAAEGKAELKRIDDQLKANKAARMQERRDAAQARLDAHKAAKAAAIARATIDAAANAVALTAAFAYLGPAAPAAALGVAGGQLALQIAAIRKTKPPKFATGGMVRDRIEGDHAVIAADPNEAILTPRGVMAAGGPQGVDALNRGGGMSGGGSRVYLDSRLLGEVVARVVESDMRVTSAMDRRSGAIPGKRR